MHGRVSAASFIQKKIDAISSAGLAYMVLESVPEAEVSVLGVCALQESYAWCRAVCSSGRCHTDVF